MVPELLTAAVLMAALPAASPLEPQRLRAAPAASSAPLAPARQEAARDPSGCPAGQGEAVRAPLSLVDAHVLGWGRLPYAPARTEAADAPASAHPALSGKDLQACKS